MVWAYMASSMVIACSGLTGFFESVARTRLANKVACGSHLGMEGASELRQIGMPISSQVRSGIMRCKRSSPQILSTASPKAQMSVGWVEMTTPKSF